MRPNIFEYATSELSQDAFIAWLLACADSRYENDNINLHRLAKSFAKLLIDKHEDYSIETIKVKKQWKNIDVSALINDEVFLIIEDKKHTKTHSDQLKRYREIARKEYGDSKQIKLVYFKMIEQSSYKKPIQEGFRHISRNDILELMYKHQNNLDNDIVLDYYGHLLNIDKKIKAFKEMEFNKWDKYQWIGFYTSLQEKIQGNWSKTNNANGGFIGFDWSYKNLVFDESKFQQYLQLEENKLVFKLYIKDKNKRRKIRDEYRKLILKEAKKHNFKIKKSGRLGKTTSVATLTFDYRLQKNGKLDIDKTISFLQHITDFHNKINFKKS